MKKAKKAELTEKDFLFLGIDLDKEVFFQEVDNKYSTPQNKNKNLELPF